MAYVKTVMDCTSETIMVSGAEKVRFKVVALVTDKGDFPDKYLYVIKIVDPTDAKDDTFTRVVTVPDFSEIGIDRTTAVAASASYYRVLTHTFYYDNVHTAAAAKDVLKARIDELAENWVVYDTAFSASSEVTDHPRPQPSAFTAAVKDHTTQTTATAAVLKLQTAAKTTYEAAKTAATAATTAATNAKKALDDAEDSKEWFDDLLSALSNIRTTATLYSATGSGGGLFSTKSKTFKAAAGSFYTQGGTFQSAAQVLLGQCASATPTTAQKSVYSAASSQFDNDESAFSSAKAIWDSALTQFDGDLTTFRQDVAAATLAESTGQSNQVLFAAIVTTLGGAYTTAQAAQVTADQAVATTRTAYEDAKAAYTASQSLLDEKLTAVRALKPTWTPT